VADLLAAELRRGSLAAEVAAAAGSGIGFGFGGCAGCAGCAAAAYPGSVPLVLSPRKAPL